MQLSQGAVIGQGANGSVCMAELKGEKVAVKQVNPNAVKPLAQL
jgi:hypothetical protein